MIKACDILRRCTEARRRRWGTDEQCEVIEDYYNGGFLPSDDCGNETPSLGLGVKQLRRPHDQFRATLEVDGGPVEVTVAGLDDFQRTTDTKLAIEAAMWEWCRDNFRTLGAQIAGDMLVSGRAFAWRSSKWDAKFHVGKPLHEAGASTDITDDSFFWWAFPYKLTLRDIDHFLATARGADGKGGWQKDALRSLKEYIIRKPHGRDESATFSSRMIDDPFPDDRIDEPLHCYIYFEKSPKKTGVHRKVNVRIVSRWGEKSHVSTLPDEKASVAGGVVRKLAIKNDEPESEQVIFAQDDAFDSVLDCLISWIKDARISGQQLLDEVEGDGKQFLPRLMAIEEMMDSAVSGTTFGMQVNYTTSQDVPKRVAARLQETGLPKHTVAPRGIGVLDKSNVITSSRAGLELVQALGMSIEEESSLNNLPQSFGKRTNAQFAGEIDMLRSSNEESTTIRFIFWYAGWDLLWSAVGRTLTRVNGWAKADPSFYEAKAIQKRFVEEGGKMADLAKARFTFRARRLPGGADRQTAMQRFLMIVQSENAPAEYQQWAFKELMKLNFGNEVIQHFEGRKSKPDPNQIERALMQTNAATASLIPLPAELGDDPILHLMQVHGPALMAQIQMIAQKGYREVDDNARVQALVQHMSFDVANIPGVAREQATQYLQGIVKQFMSIPEQAPMNERQMAEAKLQLEAMRTQKDIALGENLIQNRNAQLQLKQGQSEFGMMATAKNLGQQDRRIQVEEEKARREATSELLQPVGAGV